MFSFRHRTAPLVRLLSRAILALVIVLMIPGVALAAQVSGGDTITIGPGETINDDLYIAGGNIVILGTVNGDVVVAGGTVTITGPVHGDVLAAAGTTVIQGPIGRNVRAMGGTIRVDSTVAQDVAVAGGDITLGPAARVGRDLLVGAGTATLDGAVTGNAILGSGNVTLNGPVGGNVKFDGSTLRLGSGASIGGDLTYTSDTVLATPAPGIVRGQIIEQPRAAAPRPSPIDVGVATGLGWLRSVVGLFVLGALLVLLFPVFTRRAADTIRDAPVASVVGGFVALIVVPILAILVFALGIVIGGWWLGLALLAVYAIALAVALTVAALFAGTWLLDRAGSGTVHPVWALLLGVALLLVIGLVPVIGGIVTFAALLFGLGALLVTAYRMRNEAVGARTPTAIREPMPRAA